MTTKILCGINGQMHSPRVAEVAFELASALHAELILCMVNPLLPGRGAPLYLWPEEYIERTLNQAILEAGWSGLTSIKAATWHAFSVADAIVAHANKNKVAYIVLGTSDRPGLVKTLSGSVSRDVIAKANCPVLIVGQARDHQPSRPHRGHPIRDVPWEMMPSPSLA